MNEQEIKFLSKWFVDNANRPLTYEEKELIKQAIDKARNVQELAAIALIAFTEGR